MQNRYYVVKIVITSSGNEERTITPYDDLTTAQRKYHEAFNTIGGGPQLISAEIIDRYLNVVPGYQSFWQQPEPEPVEE